MILLDLDLQELLVQAQVVGLLVVVVEHIVVQIMG